MVNSMNYNLNQLATITGYTTRSLRNYIKDGILNGEKIDGNWSFTEEEVTAFMSDPGVRQGLSSKQLSVVYDFLADTSKRSNRICTVLDFPVSDAEARNIAKFFCDEIAKIGHDISFKFMKEGNLSRFVLSGSEDVITDIMKAYYER